MGKVVLIGLNLNFLKQIALQTGSPPKTITTAWAPLTGTFDLIIVTVGVPLDWDKIIALLAPNGKLHIVGILAEPIPVSVLLLLAYRVVLDADF